MTGGIMSSDGSPCLLLQNLIAGDPARYKHITALSGGFHHVKEAVTMMSRVVRQGHTRHVLQGYRDTDGAWAWFVSPGDPRQTIEETIQMEAAKTADQLDAFISDPEYYDPENPENFDAVDVIKRNQDRADVCPVAAESRMETRAATIMLAMEDSSRGECTEEDFATYCACMLVFATMYAATNASNYVKLIVFERIQRLTESKLMRAVVRILGWCQKTAAGRYCFSDLWVELQNGVIRKRFPNKGTASLIPRLADYLHTIVHNHCVVNAGRVAQAPRPGTLSVSRLFESARGKYRTSNIHGHKGINTMLYVQDPSKKKGTSIWVACNLMISLDGTQLSNAAMDWPAEGTRRLKQFLSKRYGTEEEQATELPSNLFAVRPHLVGDQGELAHTEAMRKYTMSVHAMMSCRCKETGETYFSTRQIAALLYKMKVDQGVTVEDNAGKEYLATSDAIVKYLKKIPDGVEPKACGFARKGLATKEDHCNLLRDLRTAAGFKEPVRGTKTKKGHLLGAIPATPLPESTKVHVFYGNNLVKKILAGDAERPAGLTFVKVYGGDADADDDGSGGGGGGGGGGGSRNDELEALLLSVHEGGGR